MSDGSTRDASTDGSRGDGSTREDAIRNAPTGDEPAAEDPTGQGPNSKEAGAESSTGEGAAGVDGAERPTGDGPAPEGGRAGISRRELLRAAGAAGAAALFRPVPGGADDGGSRSEAERPAREPRPSQQESSGPPRPTHVNLTAREAEILDAMVDRLIPADEHGPGAREAGVVHYIDRALGGPLAEDRETYRAGLEALDRYARYSRGAPFVELPPEDQDSVLFDVQGGSATGTEAGFPGSSASFFYTVRSHVWQGMFGDPAYGGNVDFAGWSLVGYPGLRLGVDAETQERLEEGELSPSYRSAYDFPQFE